LKKILVLFPNEWDRAELARPRYRGRYGFVFEGFDLFRFPENARLIWFDARRFVDRIVAKYRGAGLDGVVSNEEQFGAMIAAVVAERLGLPTADPRAIMVAQHKYYSRLAQARVAPEATPRFGVFPYTVRRPEEIARSACVLVVLDRAAGDRPVEDGVTPLEGSPERIGAGLRELAEAGADEAILVASPITEGSIRALGEVVAGLDS